MDRERTEIAILYLFSKKWVAGAYYIQNLIQALNTLEDVKKPLINVFCNCKETFVELVNETKYPYLAYHYYDYSSKFVVVKMISKFGAVFNYNNYKKIGALNLKKSHNICVYPVGDLSEVLFPQRILVWIPDFQEKYYPNLFSKIELFLRKKMQLRYVKNNVPIVFSSHDAENDFKKYYPQANNSTYVLQFAVSHPDFSDISISKLKTKFNFEGEYFFCANQFWKHKNHLFLFKAYKKYLDNGGNKLLVCSGALSDFRNKKYNDEIKDFIDNNKLKNKIKILGFIDRREQLCLMNNSYAVIQPSLFEGWSTVVEDVKKLNKFIFVSNLKVHLEQNPINSSFFDPTDINDLAYKMLNTDISCVEYNYQNNIKEFAETFFKIILNFQCK